MRRWVRTVIAAATALVLAAGTAAPGSAASTLRGWRDGPVRVLLSDAEYERFGALRTDDERSAFIERFWGELEATPQPAGEGFRATFEKRCAIANERFKTIWSEGWNSDRGRVYLILGEPSSVRREPGGQDAVEKDVWRYEGAAEQAAALEISFYRCMDGSYRADPSCRFAKDPTSVSFDWERNNYLRWLRDSNPQLTSGRLRQLLNELLASLPRSVPASPAVAEAAAPGASSGGPPQAKDAAGAGLLDAVEYYFRAQDGSVLAFLLLRLAAPAPAPDAGPAEGPAAQRYAAAAAFRASGSPGERAEAPARSTALDPAPAGDGGTAFFGRAYLESGGDYAVRYAVKDAVREELLVETRRLKVPDIGTGFAVSSLVPAERFGPAGPDAGDYRVGSEEVVPKPGARFRRSELLRLYLQVYGAAVDPERSMSRVDVVFRFYRDVNGSSKRFGKPFSVREAAGASMGLALPVGDWPSGAYRVTVELHDRVGGDRVRIEGSFTIVEG